MANGLQTPLGNINIDIDSDAATKIVAKIVKKNSISKLAKDSIFQFPTYISASIDTDEIFILNKSIERNYASLMASVASLYNYVDLEKYGSIIEYLRTFHTNNIGGKVTLESAMIDTDAKVVDVNLKSLWDCVTEQVDTTCINDMYRPFERTKRILSDAMEAASVTHILDVDAGLNVGSKRRVIDTPLGKSEKIVDFKTNNSLVRDDSLMNMTPTLLNLSFVVDTAKGNMYTQNVLIGIRGAVRMIRSSAMVSNMVESTKNGLIFKIISYTKGEISTAEFLFGFGAAAKEGIDAARKDKWIASLAKKKYDNKVQNLIGRKMLPNASVIITEQEAMEIKAQCGVDFHNVSHVKKFFNNYFALNFGIYDTESKVLDIISDVDTEFNSYSLKTLIAQNQKETNVLTTRY